jgi:hypothetical protein
MENRKERRQREREFKQQVKQYGTEWDNLIIMTKAADYAMHIGDRDLLVKARNNMVTAQRALTKAMFPGNAAAWEESEAGIAEWQQEWAIWDVENEARASGRLQ